MENREVAKILQETAQLLEIDGAIIGRYRSYEKVAELLYSIHERIEDLAKDDAKLKALPGVGDGMAEDDGQRHHEAEHHRSRSETADQRGAPPGDVLERDRPVLVGRDGKPPLTPVPETPWQGRWGKGG